MLKRYFFSAFTALILLFVLCLANGAYMERIMAQATAYADQALDIAKEEDFAQACSLSLELHRYWHKHRDYLESVLPHNEVDEITETLSNFVSAGLTGDMEDFVRTKLLLCEQFEHLAGIEKLQFHNIL